MSIKVSTQEKINNHKKSHSNVFSKSFLVGGLSGCFVKFLQTPRHNITL